MHLLVLFFIFLITSFPCISYAHDDDDDYNGCNNGRCSCSLGLNTVAFGNMFNPLNNTTAEIPVNLMVTCTLLKGRSTSVSYTVKFASGSGTVTSRFMNGIQSNKLYYNLFKDSGHTQILGGFNGGTFTFSNNYTLGANGCASPCTKNHTIFAQIPVQSLAVPYSNYRDTLTVTLNY